MFRRGQDDRLQAEGTLRIDNASAPKAVAAEQRHGMIKNVQDFQGGA
jgi:hypothetical protein